MKGIEPKPRYFRQVEKLERLKVNKYHWHKSEAYINRIYDKYEIGDRIKYKKYFKENYKGTYYNKDWEEYKHRDELIATGQYEVWKNKQYYNAYMKKLYDTIGSMRIIEVVKKGSENVVIAPHSIAHKFYKLSLDDFMWLHDNKLLPIVKMYYTDNKDQIKQLYGDMDSALQALNELKDTK